MEFNSEQTLKEVNVSWLIDTWDLRKEDLSLPKKYMDINCAFGYTTRYFLLPELHMNSTLLGVDSSEKMINHARTKYKTDERIDFETFDIQTKNLPHNYIAQYDHIFSFPTLYSRNNIQQEFKNIYNILKPGGSFHLSMITSHDVFTLYEHMVNHSIFGSYFEEYVLPFRHPEIRIRGLLTHLGFKTKYVHFIPNMKYKSNYLIPYIFYGLSFVNELSSEQQKALKSELTNSYNTIKKRIDHIRLNNPDFDSGYHDVYDVLYIYALKPQNIR